MFRDFCAADRAAFLKMAASFYASGAAAGGADAGNFERTFDQALGGSPYVRGIMIERGGRAAGYALLALTWSNEAGGPVVWVEELYVARDFRGRESPGRSSNIWRPSTRTPRGSGWRCTKKTDGPWRSTGVWDTSGWITCRWSETGNKGPRHRGPCRGYSAARRAARLAFASNMGESMGKSCSATSHIAPESTAARTTAGTS